MEKAGGGTLTIKKGTYYISNAIYVPSNTKVVFENGVVFKKNKQNRNKLQGIRINVADLSKK